MKTDDVENGWIGLIVYVPVTISDSSIIYVPVLETANIRGI